MIQVHELTKIYLGPSGRLEENVLALSNISLRISAGSVVAIMGESGSGKTTLLNILTGRVEATTGKVIVDNVPLHLLSDDELHKFKSQQIHYVHQDMRKNLQYELTVGENLFLFEQFSPYLDGRLLEGSITDLGLENLLDTEVRYLSGGEKQMVCLAIALSKKVKVLVLDEPTSALDEVRKHVVIQKVIEKCREQGITLIYTSHDPEISPYSDLIIGINYGRFDRILKNRGDGRYSSEVKSLVHGIYQELPVDAQGAVHLPQYVLEKLQIEDMVQIVLEEDHVKIYPVKRGEEQ